MFPNKANFPAIESRDTIAVIMAWGLWKSLASALLYIDVSVRPSSEALFFFGHLLKRFNLQKKRKDNGKRIFPDEIVLRNLVIMRFSRVLRGVRLVQISGSPLR